MAGFKTIVLSIFSIFLGVAWGSMYLIALGGVGILLGIGLLFLWDYAPSKENKKNVVPTTLGYCSDCGVQILPGYMFCQHCGKSFSQEKSTKVSYCSQCGVENSTGYQFCTNCGNRL